MLRTVVWFIYFWVYLLCTIPALIRLKILDNDDINKRDKIVFNVVTKWAKRLVKLSGSSVEVIGEENIPKDCSVLFVSNHQSNFDIPLMLGFINKPKAFIAKKELKRMPIINIWMKYLQCIFIDRGNIREALKSIKEGVKKLKSGYSIVVFPEGTRSKDGTLGEFKPGSLRLGIKSGSPVVPITIKGSKDIMIKGSMIIKPADVKIIISQPIYTNDMSSKDSKELTERVKEVIEDNFKLN